MFVAIFFIIDSELYALIRSKDSEAIIQFFGENIFYTLFMTFIIMLIQNSFTVIPLVLVVTVNIALFGFFYGFMWSWLTSIVSASLIFITIRSTFQSWLLNKINSKILNIEKDMGFIYILQGRIIPFIPASFINIAAGLSTISFRSYFFGTAIGNFIYFIILAFIPAGLLAGNLDLLALGIIGIMLFFAIILYRKFRKRGRRKESLTIKDKQEM